MKQSDRSAIIKEYKRITQEKETVDYARIKADRERLLDVAGIARKRPKSP